MDVTQLCHGVPEPILNNMDGMNEVVALNKIERFGFSTHHNPNCWGKTSSRISTYLQPVNGRADSFHLPDTTCLLPPNNPAGIRPLLLSIPFSGSYLLNDHTLIHI